MVKLLPVVLACLLLVSSFFATAAFAANDSTQGKPVVLDDKKGEQGFLSELTSGILSLFKDITVNIASSDIVVKLTKGEGRDPELGKPFVDLTPKQKKAPLTTGELASENSKRKQQFEAKKNSVERAPKDAKLPAFRMQITPAIEKKISRGQVFQKGQPFLTKSESSDNRFGADSHFYILDYQVAYTASQEVDTPLRLIAYIKPKNNLLVEGEQYGRLTFFEKSLRELQQYKSGATSPYDFITLDQALTVGAVVSDAFIHGPEGRTLSNATGAVGVCIVDTGLDYTASRFASNYVGGIDVLNNDSDPTDDNGHGTEMADIILTVAPGAQLYVAKALNTTGGGYASDVIQAIDWCMQQDVTIISLSLGGGQYESYCDNSPLAQKANEAVTRGFFVAAAAGNDGYGTMNTPACGSLVTSVGGSDRFNTPETVWGSSSLSNVTDILAPSKDVSVRTLGGSLNQISGTSAATAFVAGAAAVTEEYTAEYPQALQDRLRSTGVVLSYNGESYPRVDLGNAINNTTNGLNLVQTGYESNNIGTVVVGGRASCGAQACGDVSECAPLCSGTDTECIPASCDASVCQFTSTGCTNACERCTDGACQPVAGGTDPDNDCNGGYSCSGQTIIDGGLCNDPETGGCGFGTTTCLGVEYSVCQAAHSTCQGSCSNGLDDDGNEGIDSCDSDCPAGSNATGYDCNCARDCSSNLCRSSYFNGSVTGDYCVPNLASCVAANGTVYSPGGIAASNTCYGNTLGGSAWIYPQGQWTVKNTTGAVLAIVDRYGSFAIRGTSYTLQSSFDRGWTWINSTGATQGSISYTNGSLKIRGTVANRTGSPSGTGINIKNSSGTTVAVFDKTGNIFIRGDYTYNVTALT